MAKTNESPITMEEFIEEASDLLKRSKNLNKIILEGDKTSIVIEKPTDKDEDK